jgi:hypothetical protein
MGIDALDARCVEHGTCSAGVVGVRVGEDDPRDVAGVLADVGEPGDDSGRRPLEAAVDEGD